MQKIIFLIFLSSFLVSCTSTSSESEISPGSTTSLQNSKSFYEWLFSQIPSTQRDNTNFRSCVSQALENCAFEGITDEALISADPSLCQNLSTEKSRSNCQTSVFMKQAQSQKNIGLCDGITENAGKFLCYKEVLIKSSIDSQESNTCAMLLDANIFGTWVTLSEQEEAHDTCILQMISQGASKEKDLCDLIKNQVLIPLCKSL